jgi:hypothetical protein
LLSSGSALAESVTYDFTGTVTQSSGQYSQIAAGSSVTGSFTFDYAATIPGQGALTTPVGSPTDWVAESNGGSGLSLPVPSAFVFTMTATAGGTTFDTGISSYVNYDSVDGLSGTLHPMQQIYSDTNHQLNLSSSLNLLSDYTPGNYLPYAYLSNGLPNLAAIELAKSMGFFSSDLFTASGSFTELGTLSYSLASITPASAVPPGGVPVIPTPIPASTLLLLTGLVAFGALGHQRWATLRQLLH